MRKWLSAAVLGSLLMLHNAQRLAPVPLFDELRLRLGTDYVGVGNLFGAYLLAYALFTIPAGMLADRYANRRVMSCGVLLSLLAGVAFALTVNYPMALVSRVLLGIAGALLYVPAVRHVVATFPKEKRGAVMGCVEMGAGAGMAFSLILLPLFAVHSTLETTFLSLSVLASMVLTATLIFLPSTPPSGSTKSRGTRRRLVKDHRFWNLLVFHFLGMLSIYAAMGWLPTFLRTDFDYSAVRAGLVSTLVTVALSVCSPLAGVISDRLGKRTPVLIAGSIMAGVGFAVFILSHNAWAVSAAALLLGVSMAFTVPVLMIMVGEMFGQAGPGFSVSVAGTVGQISSSLSGLMFGYALQVSSSFAVVWGLALVCTIIRIPFLLGAKEKGGTKTPAPH
jgi:MFS family permease